MTDDLKHRLRDEEHLQQRHGFPALLATAREAADRIEELEAKLAKAVEALEKLDVGEGWAAQIARATLAELTGGKDD